MNPREALRTSDVYWCLGSVGAALIPHVPRLSPMLTAGFVLLAAWRVAGARGLLPLPDRRHRLLWLLKQVLAVGVFAAVYIAFRGQLGRDAGVALLAGLIGLKSIEMTTARDYYVVSFLAYFLVATNFFYSQTLPTAGYLLAVVVLITAGLVHFNGHATGLANRDCLGLAGRMVAQSLPLMAVAFLLFPRLPGPLWGMPQDAYDAVTGLSDEMSIGEVARLGISDEVAFRVAFADAVPSARDLYWRGPVLWHTDGRTWRARAPVHSNRHPVMRRGRIYRYEVLFEPSNQRWLLGLDAVTNTGEAARALPDLSLVARTPVKRRLRYTLESATAYALPGITADERAAALALPPGRHPRAVDLAQRWWLDDPHAARFIARVLRHFNEERFVYTLTPSPLARDPVDEFLFETREGFCEHYAAAFVILMRAAGLPARVVTGYQGGEFNAVSDYMVVRQRDAHAWAEVYLPPSGWVRVDPTAAVAPERVSLGIDTLRPAGTPLALLNDSDAAVAIWRHARNLWDAATYHWSQRVLAYNGQRQLDLLERLGFTAPSRQSLLFLLGATASVIALMLTLALTRRRAGRAADPAAALYARFCGRLARVGLGRVPHEGPRAFAARVATCRPDLAAEVNAITTLYTLVRYAGAKSGLSPLAAKIRAFRPSARPRVS